MQLKILNTEKDDKHALKRFEVVFDARTNTPEGDETEQLSLLIEDYENKNNPIETSVNPN
jgi:HTH-type transcriptional regulator/antitoxin HigA